jgi:hypothetical protein
VVAEHVRVACYQAEDARQGLAVDHGVPGCGTALGQALGRLLPMGLVRLGHWPSPWLRRSLAGMKKGARRQALEIACQFRLWFRLPMRGGYMLISNYGLHWKRDEIHWGWRGPGNAGSLLGRVSTRVKSPEVDFRNQSGIYVLQDRFVPVYIGQTGSGADNRLFNRLKEHTWNRLAERWDRFSWFGIAPVRDGVLVPTDDHEVKTTVRHVLNHVEGVLISITEPSLNRQGARFGEAEQYVQILSEDEEDEIENEK